MWPLYCLAYAIAVCLSWCQLCVCCKVFRMIILVGGFGMKYNPPSHMFSMHIRDKLSVSPGFFLYRFNGSKPSLYVQFILNLCVCV